MKTLRRVIVEIGYNYMDEVRNGSSLTEFANEAGYRQCDACKLWCDVCDLYITDGMDFCDHNICDDCMSAVNPTSRLVKKYQKQEEIT